MLLRTASVAIAAALAGAPAVALAGPEIPVAAEHTSARTTPAQAPQQESQNYAAREQQNQKVADYQGGSLVVVGVSGTAIVVLLLLLLILA